MRLTFNKEKIATQVKVSRQMLLQTKVHSIEDYLTDTFIIQIDAFVASQQRDLRVITVDKERPTFLDWLLRRKRQFLIKVKCREVLTNPPKLPEGESVIMYEAYEVFPSNPSQPYE